MATFTIKNLRLRTVLGITEEERKDKQDVILTIRLWASIAKAIKKDEIGQCMNYRTICKQVIHMVETSHFYTLEKLVGEALLTITTDERITRATVKIEKPHALRFADSVSIEEEFVRNVS